MKQQDNHSSLTITFFAAVTFFLILAVFGKSQAAGLLKPKHGDDSKISIKSHHVDVVINNGFARTEVDQVFTNAGNSDMEAIYSFPLPEQASLSELSFWIDGREVIGEVVEKQKARTLYEEQKAKGNRTAVAEKDDHKTFNVSIYPVKAQGETRVRLVYYQPLAIDLNVGRYVYPMQEGGVDEERISFWSVDEQVKESFSFNLELKSSQPIKDVRLPGLPQAVITDTGSGDGEAGGHGYIYNAKIETLEGGANLQDDIVFYYRLDDSSPARVELVPYRVDKEGEGTFMLTITPGASLSRISEGIDWVFVLDKSGSMGGGKIKTLVDGVSRVIGKLNSADRFKVITFNNHAEDVTGGFMDATEENINTALKRIKRIQAGGGTALHAGLSRGLKNLEEERTSSVVLVTDGVANVGPTQKRDFFTLVDQKDVRLFTFMIGNSGNRPLLESLAKVSGGFSMDISHQDDIYGRILQAKSKVLYEALHDVEVRISGDGISNLTPASPGSLYQGQQLVLFGRYAQPGPISITLQAKISGQEQEWQCPVMLPETDGGNPEIERLWALSSIEERMDQIHLDGESSKLRGEVVALGKEYSLVTDYTSMLVLNEEEMENEGIHRHNAKRVEKERKAQQKRKTEQPKSYRADKSPDGGMFKGAPSPGVGSGPVGPWFIMILGGCLWLARRKK